jgi:ATP-dependent RNA helicase DHX29
MLITTTETPVESPLPSGANTPRVESDTRHVGSASTSRGLTRAGRQRSPVNSVAAALDYDSDIDPDDLLPVYLESKTKLFQLQQTSARKGGSRVNSRPAPAVSNGASKLNPESEKLLRKIKRIEDDVLFDQYLANQQWESKRILLERDAAARRNIDLNQNLLDTLSVAPDDSDDEVSKEAAKMGAALLEEDGSDDDAAIAELFASLPVNEVDPLTGKSTTVVNGKNGIKVTIRDFGKWTGVNPTRVLEEACRAR